MPPENHFTYSVAEVDTACADLVGQGYSIEVAPKEYYWGYLAYMRDMMA